MAAFAWPSFIFDSDRSARMSTTPKTTEGREIRLAHRLHSYFGRMRHWPWQRMAFPYVCGEYGGAAFVLLYLVFLMILGLPILVMEYAVGRASQKSCARSYNILEPEGTKWHWYKWFAFAGNYILMMFYTTVAGWMMRLRVQNGDRPAHGARHLRFRKRVGRRRAGVHGLLADPFQMLFWMVIICGIGFFIVGLGLQNGVERVTKVMMACLFVAIVILAINSVMLPGAQAGLEFYLMPDFGKMIENGFGDAVYAAMGQAFFTLSIGASGMAIFGSYIGRDRRLTGEAAKRRRPFHAHFAARRPDYFSPPASPMAFHRFGLTWCSSRCRAYSTKYGAASCEGTLFFIF